MTAPIYPSQESGPRWTAKTVNMGVDQVHIQDLIGVGLLDESWLLKVPPELAPRLKAVLDTPDG